MKRNLLRCALPLAALVALLAPLALADAATAAAPEQLAAVTTYANGVDFRPNADFRAATLTVSGNGKTYQQTFAAGKSLLIGLFDPEGEPLADGIYTWRLALVPDAATARELRRAASLAGGRPEGAWEALTGTFAIRGGQIVTPELREAEPRRATRAQSGLASAFPASSFGPDRRASEDDDAAVGSRVDAEAQLRAASRRSPAAPAGALIQADRPAGEDSDAFAAALGRSLERADASTDLSAQSRQAPAPRPRSDGSNGRPRSQ